LHIISGNDNGGGGTHVLNICNKCNKNFDNIIGCVGKGPLYSKVTAMDITFKLFSEKLNNIELVNFIDENSINIVSFHGAKPFLMHLFLKNKLPVPTVAVVHSDFRYDFLNNKLKYYLFTPLSIKGLKGFKNYICVSNNLKNLLEEKRFIGTKAVVNNGIDMKKIHVMTSAMDMRNNLKLSKNDFIYVMVARLHPIKNHKQLIIAFSKLALKFQDLKLLIIGDGELRPQLEKLIEDLKLENKVTLVGNVTNPIDYINCSNVSVLVSLSEGGAPPLAVLESGAVKTPIIYTMVGDLEYILDEHSGYKVVAQDNENIQSAMEKAYLDKNNLKGENLYNIVIKQFTIEKFWKSYY
jgi:glycosyltransferase involved in cell wall biosynthesis